MIFPIISSVCKAFFRFFLDRGQVSKSLAWFGGCFGFSPSENLSVETESRKRRREAQPRRSLLHIYGHCASVLQCFRRAASSSSLLRIFISFFFLKTKRWFVRLGFKKTADGSTKRHVAPTFSTKFNFKYNRSFQRKEFHEVLKKWTNNNFNIIYRALL